jgi:lysophospholipase L1-like esterase
MAVEQRVIALIRSLKMTSLHRCRSWAIVLSFSVLLLRPTLVLADTFHNPTRDTRQFGVSGPTIAYAVLGDSTAAGQGAPYEDGIAVLTARRLAETRIVRLTNFAVSGAMTRDVLDGQLPAAERARPDLVLISVGANDVTHLTSIRSVRSNIVQIIRRLRTANPDVAIVMTGSPDMGAPPRVPGVLRPFAAWQTRRINRMFESVARANDVTFAPIASTTGPLFRQDHSLFADDRFHPNDRGYATWLPALDRALDDALGRR